MHRWSAILIVLALGTGGSCAVAQDSTLSAEPPLDPGLASTPPPAAEAPDWEYSVSLYTYIIPNDSSYAQPTVMADRGWLHLEARYNYEALQTGSLWLGYNFAGGQEFEWALTPMLGGVIGETDGIAPGYEATFNWWKLTLYGEGEYVFDLGESGESFFYSWTELSLAPVEWFRFGYVVQRTRAYESDRDVQRGVLAGFNYRWLGLTAYLFNLDERPMTVVIALNASF